jgi:hypothetical protein
MEEFSMRVAKFSGYLRSMVLIDMVLVAVFMKFND